MVLYDRLKPDYYLKNGSGAGIFTMKPDDRRQIDRIDERILRALSQDGRMSVTDLAARVGLSKSPTQVRLQRLVERGVIRGFRAILDPIAMRRDHVAFVEVKLIDTSERALTAFNEQVRQVAEIEQCHMIAGAFDYLLKVRTHDIREYRRVLGETISALPFVESTSTHVSMEAVKDTLL